MKRFWLAPKKGAEWIAPAAVAERLLPVFDHVFVDREEGKRRAEQFLKTYRLLMDLSKDAIPYPVVERRWSEAILLQAWDDKEDIPFETVVRTEDDLEIFFLPKTASSMKRQIIKKICEALDYEARFLESD